MSHLCQLCHREMQLNNLLHAPQHQLYVCNLCQAPNHDSMFKELYLITTIAGVIDGVSGEKFATKILLARAILVDEFYVVFYHNYHNYHLNHKGCPSTHIYKNITGTVANSIEFEPITLNEPICAVDSIVDLPYHNLELIKNKLKTYSVFS